MKKLPDYLPAAFLLPLLVCVPVQAANPVTLEDLRTFSDVFNQIRSHYVAELDEQELLHAAIEGMVARLDPWSEFLGPDEFRQFDDSAEGRYGGIGVQIGIRGNRLHVDHVTPGGPAQQAGIRNGDLITAVDGVPVRGRILRDAMNALLGEPGSGVEVSVMTPGQPPRVLDLQRQYLDVTSVFSLVADNIVIIRLSHFTRQSALEMQQVIEHLPEALGQRPDGIIIDLRSNPGGVINPALEIADGFLDEGLIVYTQSRYEPARMEVHAVPGQWAAGVNIVLLVDRRSASAAEVLAGALKDNSRAIVIGEKTFGKGSIQSVLTMRNGSALKLTTAHYFSPSGQSIHGTGISPDIEIDLGDADLTGEVAIPEDDPAITEAIRVLRDKQSG